MGFGYNPDLKCYGERLDILEYFGALKQFWEQGTANLLIWDASGYWIVNKTPKKRIEALNDRFSGRDILNILVEEQEKPRRAEIKENCDLRCRYLLELVRIAGITAEYINSRAVFRGDPLYAESLDVALDFVRRLRVENKPLVERIIPPGDNPARDLYLPLEIAEALYLRVNSGITAKFGPQTERGFDACIEALFESLGEPYRTIRLPASPRRPGYLSDENVIWTTSSDRSVAQLLRRDEQYKLFVEQYLQPFRGQEEPPLGCVLRLRDNLAAGGDFK